MSNQTIEVIPVRSEDRPWQNILKEPFPEEEKPRKAPARYKEPRFYYEIELECLRTINKRVSQSGLPDYMISYDQWYLYRFFLQTWRKPDQMPVDYFEELLPGFLKPNSIVIRIYRLKEIDRLPAK